MRTASSGPLRIATSVAVDCKIMAVELRKFCPENMVLFEMRAWRIELSLAI